ncbi:ribbon-helix-helix protein, CopG family [Microterricola pindariensis]|uniref:Ribbon-helix-helix protein CopG domain-containing protein n=1 Tax=Microterricola pindariensis TaxID=478010 RepID=A0ABX5AW04_9MICO|nr:ribbon-helix-helix protein, CopG family [Microterricola pindariensis]PPL17961.1 hypothetical protein GY24_10905 [Microterricola pindariensis]
MGERGPAAAGLVELRTSVTPEIDRALAHMVQLSGVSKSTLVREALALHLVLMGAMAPAAGDNIHPMRTGGRGLAALRNKENH